MQKLLKCVLHPRNIPLQALSKPLFQTFKETIINKILDFVFKYDTSLKLSENENENEDQLLKEIITSIKKGKNQNNLAQITKENKINNINCLSNENLNKEINNKEYISDDQLSRYSLSSTSSEFNGLSNLKNKKNVIKIIEDSSDDEKSTNSNCTRAKSLINSPPQINPEKIVLIYKTLYYLELNEKLSEEQIEKIMNINKITDYDTKKAVQKISSLKDNKDMQIENYILRKNVCIKLYKIFHIIFKELNLDDNDLQNFCKYIEYKARIIDISMKDKYKNYIKDLFKAINIKTH